MNKQIIEDIRERIDASYLATGNVPVEESAKVYALQSISQSLLGMLELMLEEDDE